MARPAVCLKPWCGRDGALCLDCDQTTMWEAEPAPARLEPGPDLLPHDAIDYAKASRVARKAMRLDAGQFARLLGVAFPDVVRVEHGDPPAGALRTLLYLASRNPLTVRATLRWPTGPDYLPEEIRR